MLQKEPICVVWYVTSEVIEIEGCWGEGGGAVAEILFPNCTIIPHNPLLPHQLLPHSAFFALCISAASVVELIYDG